MKEYKYNPINMTPFKWFCLENFPFIEEDFDSLTSYGLWCKLKNYFDQVAKHTNEMGEQVENLTEAFNRLKDYVENYFKNLDVQEEINNKLDEMVEDGTLENIMLNYVSVFKVYDTITQMLEDADNIQEYMKIKTLGYYEINDGGGAEYIVRAKTQSDVDDGGSIHFLSDDLVAEMIKKDYVTPEMFGAKGDGETDDYNAFVNCINFNKKITLISQKNYLISATIILEKDIQIEGNNATITHNTTFIRTTNTLNHKLIAHNVNFVDSSDNLSETNTLELYKLIDSTIQNCRFEKNYSGGCLRIRDNSSNVNIIDCDFTRDYNVLGSAVGVWQYGESQSDIGIKNITIENCIFNWSGSDEVITCFGHYNMQNININNCYINSNKNFESLAMISVYNQSDDITQDLIVNIKNLKVINTNYKHIFLTGSINNAPTIVNIDTSVIDSTYNDFMFSCKTSTYNNHYVNISNSKLTTIGKFAKCSEININCDNVNFKSNNLESDAAIILIDKTSVNNNINIQNSKFVCECFIDIRPRSETNKININNNNIVLTGDYFLSNGIGGTVQEENGTLITIKNNQINYTPTAETGHTEYKNSIIKGRNSGHLYIENNIVNINNVNSISYLFYFYYTSSYEFSISLLNNIINTLTTFNSINRNLTIDNKIDTNNYVDFTPTDLLNYT